MKRRDGKAIVAAARQAQRRRSWTRGVVTSTSPFLVEVGGSTPAVTLKRMTSYTPGLSDHVLIAIVDDGDLVVIGEFI